MDFMKVLDQTVRDIKREVNLKVLKVPEIEQKVLDATSNEPWGPHGSDLSDIAQNTKKYTECQMIMNVLWTRLNDTGPNWRHVYKALAVVEYLIANGSDRAVDDILECTSKIAAVSSFEYVEPNGKDLGINVRKKAETILGILRDKDKIQQVRNKASANRDKYIGLSSSGITYKSAPSSYGGSGFDSDRFGSFGNRKEGDSFRDGYKDEEYSRDGADVRHGGKGGLSKSRGSSANGSEGYKSKKGLAQGVSTPKSSRRPGTDPSKSTSAEPENFQDDFDDFDPRGSSTAGSSGTSANQVDMFGQSLLIDLMDAPTSVPTETVTMNNSVSSESDLFADATFVSAAPQKETTTSSPALSSETDLFADAEFVSASSQTETAKRSHAQGNINLFANQPAIPSNVDFFAAPDSPLPSETKSKPVSTNSNVFDPFAAVPLNNFEGSDPFGDFASHSDPVSKHPLNNSMNDPNTLDKHSSAASSQPAPKDTFQVKSGIWADSLSRGLIDLNITAPKKTSLADVGVVGGLSDSFDEKEKGPATLSYNYMGRSMGASMGAAGSGIGRTGHTFNQQQFPDFK